MNLVWTMVAMMKNVVYQEEAIGNQQPMKEGHHSVYFCNDFGDEMGKIDISEAGGDICCLTFGKR